MRIGIFTLCAYVPSFWCDNNNITQIQRVETWLNKEPHFRNVIYDILTNYKMTREVIVQWFSRIGDTLWNIDGTPKPYGIERLAIYLEFEIDRIINSLFTSGTRFQRADLAN